MSHLGLFEIILGGLGLLVLTVVILGLLAPARWVHRFTGDRTEH